MKRNIIAVLVCAMLLTACSNKESVETTVEPSLAETTVLETEAAVETTEETTIETTEETVEETESIIYANCEYDNYELPDYIPAEGNVYVSIVDLGFYITTNIQKDIPEYNTDVPVYWVNILVLDLDNGTAQMYMDSEIFQESDYNYFYENVKNIVPYEGVTFADIAASAGMDEEEFREYAARQTAQTQLERFGMETMESSNIVVTEDGFTIYWDNYNGKSVFEYDGDNLVMEIPESDIVYRDNATHRIYELYR